MYQEAAVDLDNIQRKITGYRSKIKGWQVASWRTRTHPVSFLKKHFKKFGAEIKFGELKKSEKNIWKGFIVCILDKDNLHRFLSGLNLINHGAIVWRSCIIENNDEKQIEFQLTFDWVLENES